MHLLVQHPVIRWLADAAQDLRFGARQLCKSPGFTSVVVATLALGIGANTALFSVVDGVLLKPLPYPDPGRLVTLWERNRQQGIDQERVSGPDYLDWRAQNTVLRDLAVSPGWEGSESFNLVLGESTIKVFASYTSASLFSTLGTRPLLGRTLLPEDDARQGHRVAVLSYGLWRQTFGGASNVLGETVRLDTYGRREYTIVGVMPPGFGLPSRCQLWLPMGWMEVSLSERRSAHWHNVIARLKPGVSVARARAELSLIQARLKQAHPEDAIGNEVDVVPLVDQAVGRNVRTGLFLLWGVVAGVLLIACANIANLLLARTISRQQEIAVRLALGARRSRLVRQLLAESLLLAWLGGLCGLFLAWSSLHMIIALSPAYIPRLADVTLDWVAIGWTLAISMLTGTLFGLAPAWHFSRPGSGEKLNTSARAASSGMAASRTRTTLVIAEVALSVLLLFGAGLMLERFNHLLRADRGFQPQHLLTAELDFSVSGFTTWTRPTATRPQVSLHTLIERLRAFPGVQAVGAGSRLLRVENQPPHEAFAVFGRSALRPEEQPKAEFKGITPDWFRALGARVVRGRDVNEADTLEAPGALLINQTLARTYFPNEDPIGQHLKMGADQIPLNSTNVWGVPVWSTVIGVVSDLKSLHPAPEAVPEVYVPYWQWPMQSPTLLVRTSGNPVELAAAIRGEVKSAIPNLPTPLIRTMTERVSDVLSPTRLQAGLLSLFAGLALLLASVGLYGVLAFLVSQRSREIGIRLALGAQSKSILGLVVGQGMKLTFVGLSVGLAASLALARLLRVFLYDVPPASISALSGAGLLLVAVALFASWIPARRAARLI